MSNNQGEAEVGFEWFGLTQRNLLLGAHDPFPTMKRSLPLLFLVALLVLTVGCTTSSKKVAPVTVYPMGTAAHVPQEHKSADTHPHGFWYGWVVFIWKVFGAQAPKG